MSSSHRVLTIFSSSPGDVAAEREILDQVVRDINVLTGQFGVIANIWHYKKDALPAIGPDAQAALNDQIPSDYEIYVGVMHGRLGTPTGRASSGTVEEFEQALKRFRKTGYPKILFYFSDRPANTVSEESAIQLQKVSLFRAQYPGYFVTYQDLDEFKKKIHDHLLTLLLRERFQNPVSATHKREWAWLTQIYNLINSVESKSKDFTRIDPIKRAQVLLCKLEALFDIENSLKLDAQEILYASAYFIALKDADSELARSVMSNQVDLGFSWTGQLMDSVLKVVELLGGLELPDQNATEVIEDVHGVISLLLHIGALITRSRSSSSESSRPPDANTSIEEWIMYYTEKVIVERSKVAFYINVPDVDLIETIKYCTVFKLEDVWQKHRSALGMFGFGFFIAPSEVSITPRMRRPNTEILHKLNKLAENQKNSLVYLPHLGLDQQKIRVSQLLPLPRSAVLNDITFYFLPYQDYLLSICQQDGTELYYEEIPAQNYSFQKTVRLSFTKPDCWYRWSLYLEEGFGSPLLTKTGEIFTLSNYDLSRWEIANAQRSQVDFTALKFDLKLWTDLVRDIWPSASDKKLTSEEILLLQKIMITSFDYAEIDDNSSTNVQLYRDTVNFLHDMISQEGNTTDWQPGGN